MKNSIKDLFKDQSNYTLAITHRSSLNENSAISQSNERLEFLGDAILEFVISKHLYNKYPNKEEGFLTAMRANLVNTINLAKVANELELGKHLLLSKGEEESGGRENQSLLANTVEALIGALYIDSGLDAAEKFIVKNIYKNLQEIENLPLKDAKSRLQEYVQSEGVQAPVYKVTKEIGPDHNKTFFVDVLINNKFVANGKGKNKSIAQQDAAEKALELIKENKYEF
ncbi:ribonuclease III [Candidatus Woesebacteria bacterium]|nr:ribonuclease III [Candidatus Woesebacteria bacterium]